MNPVYFGIAFDSWSSAETGISYGPLELGLGESRGWDKRLFPTGVFPS